MSLPESDDTEEADEPEDNCCVLANDKAKRWLQDDSESLFCCCSPLHGAIWSLIFNLLSVNRKHKYHFRAQNTNTWASKSKSCDLTS